MSEEQEIRCDKRLDNGARQCHAPASLFYKSERIGQIAARCLDHSVAAYKPELGRLLVLARAQYLDELALTRGRSP